MSPGVAHIARSTELAVGACGVVGAAETLSRLRMADLGRPLGVSVAAAVTRHTETVPFEEPSTALVTLRSCVRS